MQQILAAIVRSLPHELAVLLVSAFPVVELRGAIPIGFLLKMPPLETFLLSILGNMLPVLPILLFLNPLFRSLRKNRVFSRLADRLYVRTMAKSGQVKRYGPIGLALFVGVPLPGTGAWTGAILAALLNIPARHAFPAILIGTVLAGGIVTALCMLGKMTVEIL